jgi:hypothetical protein
VLSVLDGAMHTARRGGKLIRTEVCFRGARN